MRAPVVRVIMNAMSTQTVAGKRLRTQRQKKYGSPADAWAALKAVYEGAPSLSTFTRWEYDPEPQPRPSPNSPHWSSLRAMGKLLAGLIVAASIGIGATAVSAQQTGPLGRAGEKVSETIGVVRDGVGTAADSGQTTSLSTAAVDAWFAITT